MPTGLFIVVVIVGGIVLVVAIVALGIAYAVKKTMEKGGPEGHALEERVATLEARVAELEGQAGQPEAAAQTEASPTR